jgi:hypothetical protein
MAKMIQPAWEDYKLYMGGRFVTGVRGFSYGKNRNKELIYAEGSNPVGVGRGNVEPRCELKVLQSELEALIVSGGGDPTEIPPFTIVHQYVRKGTTAIINDVAEDVEIVDFEKAMDQGATFMEVTLQCICPKISFNVTATAVKAMLGTNTTPNFS